MQEKQRDFSIIKGRILQYLIYKGITKYAFYQRTGTTNGILSQSNGISEENLLRFLANYKDVNLTWLMRGEGDMTLPERLTTQHFAASYPIASENMTGNVADVSAENRIGCVADLSAEYTEYMKPLPTDACIGLQTVPLYDADAGLSSLLHDPEQHKPLCQLTLPGLSACDGAIRIKGETMVPTFRSGDILLYKVCKLPEGILWGEMHLIVFETPNGERSTIRYIHKSQDAKHVRLSDTVSDQMFVEIGVESIRSVAQIKASIRYNTL